MKKIKLLITSAALLVGGGLLSFSANNIMKANAADIDLTNCQYEKIDSVEELSDGNYIFGYDVNFDENTSSIKSGNFLGSFGKNFFQRTTELNDAEIINIKKDSSNGYYTLQIGEKYVEYHGKSNNVYLQDDGNIYWTPVLKDGSFHFQNIEKDNDGKDRFLEYNKNSGQERFACYKGTQQSFDLFKIIENNKYTVTLMDGDDVISTIEAVEGEFVDFTDENPVKDGFAFEGWFTEPTGGEKLTSLIVSGDIILYAHWSENDDISYLITKTSLNVEYGLIDSIESKSITFGDIFINETLEPIGSNSPTFDFAESFGLSNYFEFIGDKGSNSIGPRIWKGTEFRTYNGNNLTIKPKNGYVITSAKLFKASDSTGISFVLENDGSLSFENAGEFVRFEFSFKSKTTGATDASIRFGATLDAEKYYVDGATYGVVISAGTTSFDETLNKSNNYETFKTNLPQSHFEEITPVYVNDENDLEASETGKYIQFAAVITGLLEHKDMELTAAAFRVVDGTIELMHEKTYSVVSLAKEYISRSEELALTDEHITILNSIVGE